MSKSDSVPEPEQSRPAGEPAPPAGLNWREEHDTLLAAVDDLAAVCLPRQAHTEQHVAALQKDNEYLRGVVDLLCKAQDRTIAEKEEQERVTLGLIARVAELEGQRSAPRNAAGPSAPTRSVRKNNGPRSKKASKHLHDKKRERAAAKSGVSSKFRVTNSRHNTSDEEDDDDDDDGFPSASDDEAAKRPARGTLQTPSKASGSRSGLRSSGRPPSAEQSGGTQPQSKRKSQGADASPAAKKSRAQPPLDDEDDDEGVFNVEDDDVPSLRESPTHSGLAVVARSVKRCFVQPSRGYTSGLWPSFARERNFVLDGKNVNRHKVCEEAIKFLLDPKERSRFTVQGPWAVYEAKVKAAGWPGDDNAVLALSCVYKLKIYVITDDGSPLAIETQTGPKEYGQTCLGAVGLVRKRCKGVDEWQSLWEYDESDGGAVVATLDAS